MITIDYEKCCWKNGACTSCCCSDGGCCDGCVEACPTGALRREDVVVFSADDCVGCGACIDACPKGAIRMD